MGAVSRPQLRRHALRLTISVVGWTVVEDTGAAGELHRRSVEAMDLPGRTVRVVHAERPALVLGSNQPAGDVDEEACRRAGLEMARRRSGGGAVLVGPGQVLWVDFVVPAGDPLWSDDVGRASWWVGELWSRAISAAGLNGNSEPVVWKARLRASPWSGLICFAGVAPGEVLVGGRKVVGVSQRRHRSAALFQSAGLLSWRADDYLSVLRRSATMPEGLGEDLAGAAAGLGSGAGPVLLDALLSNLPG